MSFLIINIIMDIRLQSIKGIEQAAYDPLIAIIQSFLKTHPNVKTINIGRDEISFFKGIFSSISRISYAPYGLYYKNDKVCFDGPSTLPYVKDNLYIDLINAFYNLKPGYIIKIWNSKEGVIYE